MWCKILILLAATSVTFGVQFDGSKLLKIVPNLKKFDFGKSIDKAELDPEGSGENFLYCLPGKNVFDLEFDCPNCDPMIRSEFRKATQDQQESTGVPGIALRRFNISKPIELKGKMLSCTGKYQNPLDHYINTFAVAVPIQVRYVGEAVVKLFDLATNQAHGALKQGVGNLPIIYIPAGSVGYDLQCQVDAYPQPTRFAWSKQTSNGPPVTIDVSDRLEMNNDWFDTVWCQASKPTGHQMMVIANRTQIRLASPPTVRTMGFSDEFASRGSAGLPHRFARGNDVELTCSVSGLPQPKIAWLHLDQSGTGNRIRAVNCTSQWSPITSRDDFSHVEGTMIVNHTCSVKLNDYDQTGSYFCVGCSELAENKSICSSKEKEVPADILNLTVFGPPYERLFPSRPASFYKKNISTITKTFCANPKVQPRDVYLKCGQSENIVLLDERHGITFKQLIEVPDSPYCQDATIQFNNVAMDKRDCILHVANSHGFFKIQVEGSGSSYEMPTIIGEKSSSANKFFIVSLVLASIVILAAILGFLWMRRSACFSYRKTDNHSDDFAKSDCSSENGKMLNNTKEQLGSKTEEQKKSEIVNENIDDNNHRPAGKNGYVFVSKQVVV